MLELEYTEDGDLVDPEVSAVREILYNTLSPNFEIDSEGYDQAAHAIVVSNWLGSLLAGTWDTPPVGDNPYRQGGPYYHAV